jgi:hypothetical protein
VQHTIILKETPSGDNMIKEQKRIFLYALILTFVIFNIGIFLGYMLESSRVSDIKGMYIDAELELLDQTAQKDALGLLNLDCASLVQENINFGDRIFAEALKIQRYEDANKLTEDLIFQHKRFDLLRTLFWMNSMKIKQQCNSDYHNVVYLYQYNNPTIEQHSKQAFFSNLLVEMKQKEGGKIMLIPIAADNNISSVSLFMKKYNVTELPTILIDENIKITDVKTIDDIQKYLV